MPIGPFIPLIAAGVNAVGGAINAGQQRAANQEDREWQEKMYGIQRQDALSDWNRQNTYNSPIMQMQRYRDAGLNPNLIYGQSQTAPAVRSSSPGSYTPRAPQYDFASVANSLMNIYTIQKLNAQTDNIKAQTELLSQQTKLSSANTRYREFELSQKSDMRDFYLEFLQQRNRNLFKDEMIKDRQLDVMKQSLSLAFQKNEREAALAASSLRQAAERILTMRLEREKTAIGKELIRTQIKNLMSDNEMKQLEIRLNQDGVTKGDNIWWRLLHSVILREDSPLIK